MPQLQQVDFTPRQRAEETPFEKTLGAFANKFHQNRIEQQDSDELTKIYDKYRNEGLMIDDAIIQLQGNTMISPTKRIEASKNLQELKKTNAMLAKNNQKEQSKADKNAARDEENQKELDYLQSIKGKNLKPSEIYSGARASGISRVTANQLSNLKRMEGKEGRLSETDIRKQYDFDIKDLDKEIKELASDKKKKPLIAEREKLKAARNKAIKDFRAGIIPEETLEPAPVAASVAPEVPPQQDPIIITLTQTFPPEQFKGKSKWDKQGNEYKSDGKTWLPVRK